MGRNSPLHALAWATLCVASFAVGPRPAGAHATLAASLLAANPATTGKQATPAKAPAPDKSPSATASKVKASPDAARKTAPGAATKPKPKPGEIVELDWRELLPEKDRAQYTATAPPPEHGPLGEGGPPAVQKQTTAVNPDLNGITVRLPGFVVPIGAPRDGVIREFFLVPYIGACIHVPPPPTNQMVYVVSAQGIDAAAVHEAYWVTGKMRIENRATPLGTAAYALSASKVELYQY